jgi:hypothetical protein
MLAQVFDLQRPDKDYHAAQPGKRRCAEGNRMAQPFTFIGK